MSSFLGQFSDALVTLVDKTIRSTVTVHGMSTDLMHQSSGSGWLYDATGHVVTNAHVVAGMTRNVHVQFADLPNIPAVIVGVDHMTDLAVLRIPHCPERYQPLQVRQGPARLGELCFAFGSPLDFRESVSMGIISGTARQLDIGGGRLEEIVQTDAAINPGNSGGPLVDAHGMLIGVNVAKHARADGIGFAIPAEIISDIIPELISYGSIARGSLGITIAEVWSPDAEHQTVITVQRVRAADSPFQVNDIVIGLNDYPVTRRYDVRKVLDRTSIGKALTVRIRRAGSELAFTVVVHDHALLHAHTAS